jgi:hypothetical protein
MRSLVGLAALGLVALGFQAGVAVAQPDGPGASNPLLSAGPSYRETGRVAETHPGPFDPAGLGPAAQMEPRAETPVRVHAPRADAPATPRGVLDQETLEQEVRPYFWGLRDCRLEVARARQLTPDAVTAGSLQLRWTILPSGAAVNTVALADADTDDGVMKCVSEQMFGWRFSPPTGGPVDVSFKFNFR